MLIKDLAKSPRFLSGDKAILRELLHPDKSPLALRYSLAHAVVKAGKKTLPHRLKTSEVYYVLSGRGVIHVDDEVERVRPGQAVWAQIKAVALVG